MLLVSPRLGSPGTRFRMHLRLPVQAPLSSCPINRLRCGFINTAGRGTSGSKTVWSKGAKASKRVFVSTLETQSGARLLGLVYGLFFQPQTRAVLALVRNSAGAWFFSPSPGGLSPLSYFSVNPERRLSQEIRGSHPKWWWPLTLLAPYTRAALFPFRGSLEPKLARAPGSSALVLTSFLWERWALIVLPSGQLFVCSNKSHVLLGGLAPIERGGAYCGTAGSRKRAGKAPSVRGVAMNPNDHPHGGRTKSVKYPRTPWGKTAKCPRPPRPKLKLKALAKRKAAPVVS